jgi:hypothetical protein
VPETESLKRRPAKIYGIFDQNAANDSKAWAWRTVRDRGQRLWDTHKAVCFRVSLGSYKRGPIHRQSPGSRHSRARLDCAGGRGPGRLQVCSRRALQRPLTRRLHGGTPKARQTPAQLGPSRQFVLPSDGVRCTYWPPGMRCSDEFFRTGAWFPLEPAPEAVGVARKCATLC